MESKNILVATSLFCSQKNWPVLLKAIRNFNTTIYKKPSFCLEFNYHSGENIRFSFLVREKTAHQTLRCSDEYFKNFFAKLKPVVTKQNGEIFKSFDQNCIYYGLYKPIHVRNGEKKNYELQFVLSGLIIAALKDEEDLDSETILTLAFYLTIAVVKLAMEKFHLQQKVLVKYIKARHTQLGAFENGLVEAKFKENKAVLLEIFNSIGDDDAPGWIKKWQVFILKFFENNNEMVSVMHIVLGQIKTQLGISGTMEKMLCYFILKVLSVRRKLI